jgi:uncharacterized membrane protein
MNSNPENRSREKGKLIMHHHENTNEKASLSEFLKDTSTNVGGSERIISSIAGGALLAYGLKQRGLAGAAASLIGGGMLLRGTTGHCHIYDAAGINTSGGLSEGQSPYRRSLFTGRIHVTKTTIVDKSADELYSFWRDLENLPKFMNHLESVKKTGEKTSHWVAKAPLGMKAQWDAEITSDVPGVRIGWKSLEGAFIPNSGVVEFRETKTRGTVVKVDLTYESPGGPIGEWIAWALGEEPSLQVAEDLRRFKALMETGMVITTDGQTSGRESQGEPARSMAAKG